MAADGDLTATFEGLDLGLLEPDTWGGVSLTDLDASFELPPPNEALPPDPPLPLRELPEGREESPAEGKRLKEQQKSLDKKKPKSEALPVPKTPKSQEQSPKESKKSDVREVKTPPSKTAEAVRTKSPGSSGRTRRACTNCNKSRVKCSRPESGRCQRCEKKNLECVLYTPKPRKKKNSSGKKKGRPEPLKDEDGKTIKRLSDKLNIHQGIPCPRDPSCVRPKKHAGHCKKCKCKESNKQRPHECNKKIEKDEKGEEDYGDVPEVPSSPIKIKKFTL